MGADNENFLCNLIYPLWEHAAVVWVARPDLFSDSLETPPGAVQNDGGIFRIGMWGPGAAIVTIEDDPSIALPAPLTIYQVLMPPGGQLSIELNDPTPVNPQIAFGSTLSTVQGETLQVYCDRPVQLEIVGLENQPGDTTILPPPPPPQGPIVLGDLTNAAFSTWFGVGVPPQVDFGAGFGLPASNGLHYCAYPANLAAARAIHIRFQLTGNDAVEHVDPSDIQPCKLTAFFGLQDVSVAEERWWSDQHLTLQPGIWEMTVPLDPAVWHSVSGQHDPAGFAAMKGNPGISVGFTCGGQFFDGHGVYSADGSNILQLLSYQILGPGGVAASNPF